MESTRILVTGANGFVGRHLVDRLYNSLESAVPVRIFAAVRPEELPSVNVDARLRFDSVGWAQGQDPGLLDVVPFDICDASQVRSVVEEIRPERVFHLAARASGADADRDAVFAVNVEGTRSLLEACSKIDPFPRAVVASTGYVYGNTEQGRPAQETDPVGPLWKFGAYTDSKIEVETVARAYRAFAIITRAFSHTGPGQLPEFALPAFAMQIARMERRLDPPILRVGNLDPLRDMLDVRDVVWAYQLIGERGSPGEAYNVASGRAYTMRFLLDKLRAICAVPTQVTVDQNRVRAADILCSVGDSSKLTSLTGWQPTYALDQTLLALLSYWRKEIRRTPAERKPE
jgi:GDP-4-dehydro-6-deoxy-D-mannose reductase